VHEARLDQRDVDAERPQLVPQRLRVPLEREFAGGVERPERNGRDAGEGSDSASGFRAVPKTLKPRSASSRAVA